ncbi:MAG: TIGR04255 family protein [Solirubrobacteraceae bacterium]
MKKWNASGTIRTVFDLEPVSRYRLERPPLVKAVGQTRYPIVARLQTLDGIASVQEALTPLFPYMQQQQQQRLSLIVGPGSQPMSGGQITNSWVFTDDAGWSVKVAPDAATLEVGPQYGSFEEFEERFRAVLTALRETGAVQRCDRLGLRYVDVAEVPPEDEAAWRGWFRSELTGWIASDLVSESTRVDTSIAQTQLAASPTGHLAGPPVDVQAVIRHGYVPQSAVLPGVLPVPMERPAFLIDVDLFVDGHQAFDQIELTRQLGLFHDQIDRFFRWCLSPVGENYFGLEEL